MASKLNFRARTLDASKPMAIYNIEDLPELTDLNAINRSVPAMPSGMEKEEESEKHLQDILDAQSANNLIDTKNLVIPTPEVFSSEIIPIYRKGYKTPRQYIHVQPFSMDGEKPDYDLDSEDEKFIQDNLKAEKKFDLDVTTFEEMIDRLEKSSGHNVITAKEAKLLLKEDDDLILAVYDYWVEKRLKMKQPLLPCVKSDKRDIVTQSSASTPMISGGNSTNSGANNAPNTPSTPGLISGGSGSVLGSQATANITNTNPYIAFRRRTEKMQTRKNRKNDEASYEKMLKLRRDLSRAVVLLEMVKRREKTKKEYLNLTSEIFEKRYNTGDYEGKVIAEVNALNKPVSKAVLQPNQQYFPNRFTENWIANAGQVGHHHRNFYQKGDKKASKKRKKSGHANQTSSGSLQIYSAYGTPFQSDDDAFSANGAMSSDYEDDPQDAPFAFRRKANVQYLSPNFSCSDPMDMDGDQNIFDFNVFTSKAEPRFKYYNGSLSTPSSRYLGPIRRRVGRGGRIILDRLHHSLQNSASPDDGPHFRPVTPPHVKEDSDSQLNDTLFPSKPIRLSTFERQKSTISGLGAVRTVSVDSVGAQNAASALVTNSYMDLFGK